MSNGYGLEPVQLPQQAGALGRMEAVDKLLGSPGRVQGLHGLLERMRAQVTPLHHQGIRIGPSSGRDGGYLVVAEASRGRPGGGSQGQGGPQDSPQTGQHVWAGWVTVVLSGETSREPESSGESIYMKNTTSVHRTYLYVGFLSCLGIAAVTFLHCHIRHILLPDTASITSGEKHKRFWNILLNCS